jgi:hypothetical protein
VAFYALIDYHRIFAKVLLLVSRGSRDGSARSCRTSRWFRRYLRGLGLVCLMNTLATIFVLQVFTATRPYAAALGLIAGLLYAVPYLGAIVSTALISLAAYASPRRRVARDDAVCHGGDAVPAPDPVRSGTGPPHPGRDTSGCTRSFRSSP